MPFLPERRRSPRLREVHDSNNSRRRQSPILQLPAHDKTQYQTTRQAAQDCVAHGWNTAEFPGVHSPHIVSYTTQEVSKSEAPQYATSRVQQHSISEQTASDVKPGPYIRSMEPIDDRSFHSRPTTLLILGLTGVGKSSFISNLTAGSATAPVVGQSLQSCTKDVTKYTCKVNGIDFDLIDTPGFDDSYRSEIEVLRLISEYLVPHVQSGGRIDGVLFLHRIIDVRLSASAIRVAELVKRICGKDFYPYIALVTNMWQSLASRQVGVARLYELLSHPKFWRDFDQVYAPHYHLSRTKDSAKKILGEFQWYLTQHGRSPSLQIINELVTQRRPLSMTFAGDLLEGELRRRGLKHEEEVAQIQEEIRKTSYNASGSSDNCQSRHTSERQNFATSPAKQLLERNQDERMSRSTSESMLDSPAISKNHRLNDGTVSDGDKTARLRNSFNARPYSARTRSASELVDVQQGERRPANDSNTRLHSGQGQEKRADRNPRAGGPEDLRQRPYHKTLISSSFDGDADSKDRHWSVGQGPSCSEQDRTMQMPVRRRYLVSP
jgi:GTPase SAR1 family protein